MNKELKLAAKKLLDETVSVKVHILVGASVLLWCGKISDTVWSTVVVSIGLGRVLIESIVASKINDTDTQE